MTIRRSSDLAKIYALQSIKGLSSAGIISLLEEFQSLDNISNLSEAELQTFYTGKLSLATQIPKAFERISKFEKVADEKLATMNSLSGKIITFIDASYPKLLSKIYSPPMLLYILGELRKEDISAIAIVGTREPSDYGKKYARQFAKDLSNQNLTIVSGLARGVDAIVHNTVLNESQRTVAVVAGGPDEIYPVENRNIYNKIIENGAVISEHPPGTKALRQYFPSRNRIISGLSIGTIVIESGKKGGSLITAGFALDQNREVFAIPGNLSSRNSQGTNNLIKRGEAKLIQTPEDVLVELNIKRKPSGEKPKSKISPELSFFEDKIFQVLDDVPKQIDAISIETNISISDCLVNLLTLEFKGLVTQYPGKNFSLSI